MTYPYNSGHISISYAPTRISILRGTSLENVGSHGCFHAQQTIELVSRIGCKKSHMVLHKLCIYGQSFTYIRLGKQPMNGLSSRILEPLRGEKFGAGDIRSPQELNSRSTRGRI